MSALAHRLRPLLPQSLRWQFALALSGLAVLILTGSLVAVLALRLSAESTRALAAERLARLDDAQALVRDTVRVERETAVLLHAGLPLQVQQHYAAIVVRLGALDRLVARLGESGGDVEVLALHQSGQLFRNTAHIVVSLHEDTLQAEAAFAAALAARTGLLEAIGDAPALRLVALLERLANERERTAIERLRDAFIAQARAMPRLPSLMQDDLRTLQAGAADASPRSDPFSARLRLVERQALLQHFDGELQRQAEAMVESAGEHAGRASDEYRTAVRQLAERSQADQRKVLALLAGSLIVAWLVSRRILGKQVFARLQQVSHHLRHGGSREGETRVPVEGEDEIGEMARAVEQFLKDRRRLAEANVALEAERARQAALIEKLAETRNQLLQSEKMASIGQLAAGVAHEINNPVGFVTSNVGSLGRYVEDLFELLAAFEAHEAELGPQARTALAALKKSIDLDYLREDTGNLLTESMEGLQTVTRIVQDLKDFSHVDEAELQWANIERGLDTTLNVAWNEIKYRAEVVKAYGGVPDIHCMPSQLNQVFMNLLVNAAHAMEARGRITIRTGLEDDSVWVEVEDTGRGIAPEHLRRIFDPFFTTKPVGKGTGLGLSLSYGIVRQHGGRIEVSSEPGVGSVFRVVLPIDPRPAPEPAPDAASPSRAAT